MIDTFHLIAMRLLADAVISLNLPSRFLPCLPTVFTRDPIIMSAPSTPGAMRLSLPSAGGAATMGSPRTGLKTEVSFLWDTLFCVKSCAPTSTLSADNSTPPPSPTTSG